MSVNTLGKERLIVMNKKQLVVIWVSIGVIVAFCLFVMYGMDHGFELNSIKGLIWFLCVVIIIQSISRGVLMQVTKKSKPPTSEKQEFQPPPARTRRPIRRTRCRILEHLPAGEPALRPGAFSGTGRGRVAAVRDGGQPRRNTRKTRGIPSVGGIPGFFDSDRS